MPISGATGNQHGGPRRSYAATDFQTMLTIQLQDSCELRAENPASAYHTYHASLNCWTSKDVFKRQVARLQVTSNSCPTH
mmetsp:Transcript_165595/g.531497  ORF Transcript_165595/g.531497 Transcript_165595/m.531497 type:complete len:80 (+) Transcript_165595:103-342(+)